MQDCGLIAGMVLWGLCSIFCDIRYLGVDDLRITEHKNLQTLVGLDHAGKYRCCRPHLAEPWTLTMASRQPMPSRDSPRLPGPSQQAYEVPEFMVRRLDGQINPVLLATPDSGVTYIGQGQWAAEEQEEDPM